MTKEKLKSVFQFYAEMLNREAQRRAQFSGEAPHTDPKQFTGMEARTHFVFPASKELAHLRFMCEEACKFVDANRVEKAMRWLGFLQGVLFARGFYSLNDLKKHSRPEA
jgi:hypothetical protein